MAKYRNEWKYICSDWDLKLLESRLSGVLHKDKHAGGDGSYSVRSLYFDDYANTCAKQNEAGLPERYKWRIRYYGGGTSKHIHLEFKRKHNGRGIKKSCKLSEEECRNLIAGEPEKVFWSTGEDLLKQFCIAIMNRRFEPKAIIDYDRCAFVEPTTNIRITMDRNISASKDFDKFLSGDYIKIPIQDGDQHVLEVKFNDILPSYLQNIINTYERQQSSFSKYYFGRKKLEELI